jgi:2'-5' RNA ligase
MIRLFVAIDPGEEVRSRVASLHGDVPGARWTEPETLHLTLRFIGEVEGHVFEDIREVLHTVSFDRFEVGVAGVGHFPPRGVPRVLWAGLESHQTLQALRRRIDAALSRVGVEGEGRRFTPHMTVARLKNPPPRAVATFLSTHGLFRAGPIMVDRFFLFSSRLSPKQAVHRIEEEYPLGSGVV